MALVASFAAFWLSWSVYVVDQRTDDLRPRVVALASAQDLAGSGPAAAALQDRLFRVEAGLMGARLFVVDGSGTVLRASSETALTSLPLDLLGPPDGAGVRAGTARTTGAAGTLLLVAAPIDSGRNLVAVQSLQEVRDAQRGILLVALIAVVAGIVVAWVAGGLLARRLTAPLRRLETGAERLTAGEWGAQVPEEGDAETASLARSFNRMSSRVAAAYDAQRDFVGDVSHEIRTPLTSIRGFAQALLDGTAATPAQKELALRAVLEESNRLSEMAETLLALAELDAGAVTPAGGPGDVDLLADALRTRFAAAAGARAVALTIDLRGHGRPLGDSDRLIQAASTLVANAVAHAPGGSEVRIHAATDGSWWTLMVDDSGPGVPESERERVFERFARLDASRSSTSGGAGLGLAICRRLVALMGGTVGVSPSPGGGARFSIRLPLDTTPQHELNTRTTEAQP